MKLLIMASRCASYMLKAMSWVIILQDLCKDTPECIQSVLNLFWPLKCFQLQCAKLLSLSNLRQKPTKRGPPKSSWAELKPTNLGVKEDFLTCWRANDLQKVQLKKIDKFINKKIHNTMLLMYRNFSFTQDSCVFIDQLSFILVINIVIWNLRKLLSV